MDFGEALKALKAGKKISRKGWNGKGMWLCLPFLDEYNKIKYKSYIGEKI